MFHIILMSEHLPVNEAFISKLTDIVLSNLRDESFGVEKLAKEAGLSRFTLNRKIQSIKHQDASQFIRTIRLNEAMKMLQSSESTIAEIGYEVGFGSPAYFTKCFHEHYGYPPGKIRKQDSEPGNEGSGASASSKRRNTKTIRRSVAFLLSVAALLLFLVYMNYQTSPGSILPEMTYPDARERKSIAVLPVRNLGENQSDRFVYEGIMEEVYNSLSKIHGIDAISYSSLEQYRNLNLTIQEICRELDVDYIVEGSGQKSGRSFCLRVHLTDAASGVQVWSETFEQRMKSTKRLFRVQSQIAQRIAAELKTRISADEKELMGVVPTTDIEAYNLFKEGNNFQKNYGQSGDSVSYMKAVDLYLAALARDPHFARAYASLAEIFMTRNKWKTYFNENYLDSADLMLNKALSIDDQLDEAIFLRGEICRLTGESEKALTFYDRALSINPNHIGALANKWYLQTWVMDDYVDGLQNCHKSLALVRGMGRTTLYRLTARTYLDAGFPDLAKEYYKKAFLLDSNKSSYLGNISWVEWCKGNFDDALKIRYQRQEIDSVAISLGYYCTFKDRREEAYMQARMLIEESNESKAPMLQGSHRVGFALWQAGKREEAEYYFRQQIKYGEESIKLGRDIEQRRAAHYDLAGTYAFLGDKEKAYTYLEEFSKKRAFPLWWITMIKNDLLFESIHHEARFSKIVEKMESKYNTEHERVKKWMDDHKML